MASSGHESLQDAIRRIDAKMRRLMDFDIDLSRPGVLERMRARADAMRRQQAELETAQKEADRRWLPEMLDLYRNGSDADRQQMRELLFKHQSFRWDSAGASSIGSQQPKTPATCWRFFR